MPNSRTIRVKQKGYANSTPKGAAVAGAGVLQAKLKPIDAPTTTTAGVHKLEDVFLRPA